jgi:hypothetical protein
MVRDKYERSVKITGGLVDAYKFFKSKHKKSVIDKSTYTKICHEFNKRVSDKIIRESLELRIFHKLGFLRIKASKLSIRIKDGRIDTKKHSVDWAKTKEMWKKLYKTDDISSLKDIPNKKVVIHTNDHTNGYMMKWYWDRRRCNLKNIRMYSFRPVKGGVTENGLYYGRRGLAAWITNNERTNEYYL